MRSEDFPRDTGMGGAHASEAAGALGARLLAHAARLLGKALCASAAGARKREARRRAWMSGAQCST